MNNRMRRNNLIIKGLDEVENEGYVESEHVAREFFSKHLKHDVGDIERAHRIGRSRPDFNRPLLLSFSTLSKKQRLCVLVLNWKNLITQSMAWRFFPKVQFARIKLREFKSANKKDGEKYYVRFNKLHMEHAIYRYDSSTSQVVQVSAKNQPLPKWHSINQPGQSHWPGSLPKPGAAPPPSEARRRTSPKGKRRTSFSPLGRCFLWLRLIIFFSTLNFSQVLE